jgi:NTP pyrophosphatase (non-canonical NTP hydrolase)
VTLTPDTDTGLTYAQVQQANAARCARWHPGYPHDDTWTIADWSNAVAGEAGELAEAILDLALGGLHVASLTGRLANDVKKLRRYETGTNTAVDKPREVLERAIEDEAADVALYLDLLATRLGFNLATAMARKFNEVSARQDFPERLLP